MKIIFFGTPKEVIPVLENLTKYGNVTAVVTAPDQKSGRKQLLTPPPVKIFAEKHNMQIFQPENKQSLKSLLLHLTSDLFIVAAYGKIIPPEALSIPTYGAINIHPSLLPQYRGATPIQTALLNGDEKSGVTFIKMDEQMDHGPIIHQIPFTLEKTDTCNWLMQTMFAQAAILLPSLIENYVAGKLTPQPQDENKATYTKIITRQDGYIDLSVLEKLAPLEIRNWKSEIDRKIRAYYPWPTVWTKVKIKNQEIRIKLLPSSVIADKTKQSQTTPFFLQVEGKKPMNFKDFLNGYPALKEKIKELYTE